MLGEHRFVGCGGGEPAARAEEVEPAHSRRDMTDLIGVDAAQHGGALAIAEALEPRDHGRGDVEAARFEDERHDGEPGQQIVSGRRGGLPQPVMRRQIAVGRAERGEASGEKRMMLRFLAGDRRPIVEEAARQIGVREACNDVPGKIDRIELDMGDRVEERDVAGMRAAAAPLRHLARRQEQRPAGTRRPGRWQGMPDRGQRAAAPGSGESAAPRPLVTRARGADNRGGAGGETDRDRQRLVQSDVAAASTSPTWPSILTLGQRPRITPFSSISTVVRSMPMYLRPYMLFSTQTPYFSQTSPLSSEARMKGSEYFCLNLSCARTGSREIPTIVAAVFEKSGIASRKPQASLVQPEVSSLG